MPSRSGSDITNEDLQKTWSQLSKDFYHLRTASLPEETWINSFQRFLQIIDGKTGQKDIDTESSLWLNRAKRLRELDNAVSKALPWPQRLTELQAGLANELNKFQADKQAAALKKEWEGKDVRGTEVAFQHLEDTLQKLRNNGQVDRAKLAQVEASLADVKSDILPLWTEYHRFTLQQMQNLVKNNQAEAARIRQARQTGGEELLEVQAGPSGTGTGQQASSASGKGNNLKRSTSASPPRKRTGTLGISPSGTSASLLPGRGSGQPTKNADTPSLGGAEWAKEVRKIRRQGAPTVSGSAKRNTQEYNQAWVKSLGL